MTLEANPTSVEAGKFHAYRDAGINRVSLGIQSLEEDALKFLGREHSASEARRAITLARDIFPRMSFDLIYARHGQTKEAWARELTEAIRLAADHLSLYQLTLEPGTHFHTRSQLGEQLGAEEETAAVLYQITQEILDPLGMPAYEISNHARAGGESQHNLAYWRYWDYVGIGPGAHGRITRNGGKFATFRHRLPERWLDAVEKTGAGLKSQDLIDPAQQFNEALLMGLRLTQGVCNSSLISTTGYGLQKLNRDKLHMLIEEGYLTLTQDRLKTTSAGRLRLNAVLEYLLT
jgi:oxygen-independent coproporphyrinogen-3 oxidase